MEKQIKFSKTKAGFEITDDKGVSFIPYTPPYDDDYEKYNLDDFNVYILINPYYNKESDIFQVALDENESRDGFILPLAVLESEVQDDPAILRYSYIAALGILASSIDINGKCTFSDLFKDLDKDNVNILVINHYQKCPCDIEDYRLSLLSYGYTWKHTYNVIANNIDRTFFNLQKSIRLFKTEHILNDNPFYKQLFTENITSIKYPTFRFLLIYQVLEYLMEKQKQNDFDAILNLIKIPSPDMNQIIDKIQNLRKEKSLLGDIYNPNKPSQRYNFLRINFNSYYKEIFSCEANDESICIYNIRNKLFHSYRTILSHKEDFDKLVFISEQLIVGMLCTKYKVN
jgi:hypothetical protein